MDLSSNSNTSHFDLENLRANLEYDDEYILEFKGILKTELDLSISILLTNLEKQDIVAINATAHRIKGAALNGCCDELARLAAILEKTEKFDDEIVLKLIKQIESEITLVKSLIS